MFYTHHDETPKERELREQLERERDERRAEEDRQYREREAQRKAEQEEYRHYYESSMRSASNWLEALEKQAILCRREYNQLPDDVPEDDYFIWSAKANEKAAEIWKEVEEGKQEKLNELQRQIEAVQDEIRNEVADKLIASNENSEFRLVAEAIRDNQLDGYLDW